MNSKNNIKRADGFSLIELLITVAIIGIIAAVALPSYSEYMMKSRRVDGIAFLTEVASDQVRFYSEYNRYGSSMTELGYGTAATADSKEGFYRVSVTTPASGASYVLTATPLGSQLKDAECATLTLNSSGVKTESGTAASARDCF